jgi:histone-lysine N-methyltransferase SETD3
MAEAAPHAVHRLEEDDGWDGSIEGDDADRKKFAHPAVMERMSTVADEQRAKFEVFLEWLVSNGAHFPDLYLKCYKSNVRGVHTRSAVPPSTQIMAIPLKCLITDATARATATGAKLKEIEYQLSAPNHNHVIVHILEGMECGDTFFQPFYDILPANFDNFPVFWSEVELSFLEGSDLVAQTRARISNIRDDYDAICAKLEGFDRFTFDQFLWCRTAVGSRNFSIIVAGQKRTAMVPWADMLNHFRPRETSWTFDNAQQCFTMTSLRTLAKGQQVMDSYGKKCNSKFLLHYGFAIQSNREKDGTCMNQLPLYLALRNEDPAIGVKSAILSRRRRFNMTMNYSDSGTKVRVARARARSLPLCDVPSCTSAIKKKRRDVALYAPVVARSPAAVNWRPLLRSSAPPRLCSSPPPSRRPRCNTRGRRRRRLRRCSRCRRVVRGEFCRSRMSQECLISSRPRCESSSRCTLPRS